MKILLDTNIVLDLLLVRDPFVDDAQAIFIMIENRHIEGYLCADAITTIHYLVSRELGKHSADNVIAKLLEIFEVTPVDKQVLTEATRTHSTDYEDSVVYTSAYYAGIDRIITRDQKGFKQSKVPVLEPGEFLSFIASYYHTNK